MARRGIAVVFAFAGHRVVLVDFKEREAAAFDALAVEARAEIRSTLDILSRIGLLPSEGVEAPKTLILTDLGPSLRQSSAYGGSGFSKVPWDVFALKGCQE